MFRLVAAPVSRNKEWKCCFGFHVRTATIMIGIWHLMLNIVALGILAVIVRNPAMLADLESTNFNDDDLSELDPPLPTPLPKEDVLEPPRYAFRDHSLNYQNIDMGGIVCLCMIAITLMLIYGAVKGKPSHLLPFFCLQLFDFAITTLTAAGYVCYLRSVRHLIEENHRLPWREELLKLSPQTLSVLVLLAFISIVFLKAYAIGIIWRCYKYLTLRQHNLRSMLPYIIPDVSNLRQAERDYSSLLPDYEEAVLKQAPPPSYHAAMTGSYPIVTTTVVLPAVDGAGDNADAAISASDAVDIPPPPYQSAATAAATTADEVETEGAVGGARNAPEPTQTATIEANTTK